MSEAEDRILDFALRRHFDRSAGKDLSYQVISRWRAGDVGEHLLSLDPKPGRSWRGRLPFAASLMLGLAVWFFWPGEARLSMADPLARAEFPIDILRPGGWDPQPAASFHHGDSLLVRELEQLRMVDGTQVEALPESMIRLELDDGRPSLRLILGGLAIQHEDDSPLWISTAIGSLLLQQPARLRLRISANPRMDDMNRPPFLNLARGLHLRSLAITLTLSVSLVEGTALFRQGDESHSLAAGERLVLSWNHEPGSDHQSWQQRIPEASPAQDPLQGLRAIPQLSERLCTRMFFVYPDAEILGTSPGQFAIQYGQPAWNPQYEAELESMPGTIMRFGKDFWSTLDSSLPLDFADTKVPEGYYYIALGCEDVGEFTLNLYAPAAVRKLHMDAVQTDRLTLPAIKIPLELEELDRPAEQLSIQFTRQGESLTEAMLEITWGPFLLKTPVSTRFASSAPK